MRNFRASRRVAAISAAFPLLALGACAGTTAPVPSDPSRAEIVLDAQYAAKEKPKPMQASEADRIYEEYIGNIGKSQATEKTSSTSN